MSTMARQSGTAECININIRKGKRWDEDNVTAFLSILKKQLTFLCLFLIPFLKTIAQNDAVPVFRITTDTIPYFPLRIDSLQVLEDNAGKLTFDQVSQEPIINRFHAFKDDGFNFSVHTYWFRFRLKNAMDHDAKICIGSDAQYCDFYVMDERGSLQHFLFGSDVPWSEKSGFKKANVAPLVLKQGDEILVYRKDRNSYFRMLKYFQPSIGFTDTVIRTQYIETADDYRRNVVSSLMAGLLILGAAFNLLFFRAVREKVYLHYSLFLFTYSLIVFSNAIHNLFFLDHPLSFHIGVNLLWGAFMVVTVNFIRYYFDLDQYNRKWSRVLTVLGYAIPVQYIIYSIVLPQLPHLWVRIWSDVREIFLDVVFLLFFISAILYLRRKDAVRSRIVPALPVLFYWGIIYTAFDFFGRIEGYLHPSITYPVVRWLYQSNYLIELVCLSWLIFFFSWSLFQRYQHLQNKIAQQALEKEVERNELIAQQKIELEKEVAERTAELKQSLEDLKATQSQLIQSEKMASLGELTAGIAHEIQNPLNFVNNFSEVNNELIEELKSYHAKNNGQTPEENILLSDISQNNEKIIFHGKRADAIVKGMLQHSRTGSGQKESTDINALADEYLRLAYHGLRARDKSFNAKYVTDFDPAIGKIDIVQQDIGRVLLNLINNSFYAVAEKAKGNIAGYEPTVTVKTFRNPAPLNGGRKADITIIVKDNGPGIPAKILDKIFQPFFTTKPTGVGTGLGLSLAYDIITKGHGGELKVKTMEGEGAEFIISIPA